ncbi:MAG: DNA-binding protein [Nanoarchaeota archaeon]|nr:DNA-binding protein [Nanoarchaeota archaeon]
MNMERGIDPKEIERQRQVEALKRDIFQKYLTKEARERLSTLRYGHPDLADSVENMLVQAALSGQLKTVVDDNKLKELLKAISGEKRETRINW